MLLAPGPPASERLIAVEPGDSTNSLLPRIGIENKRRAVIKKEVCSRIQAKADGISGIYPCLKNRTRHIELCSGKSLSLTCSICFHKPVTDRQSCLRGQSSRVSYRQHSSTIFQELLEPRNCSCCG